MASVYGLNCVPTDQEKNISYCETDDRTLKCSVQNGTFDCHFRQEKDGIAYVQHEKFPHYTQALSWAAGLKELVASAPRGENTENAPETLFGFVGPTLLSSRPQLFFTPPPVFDPVPLPAAAGTGFALGVAGIIGSIFIPGSESTHIPPEVQIPPLPLVPRMEDKNKEPTVVKTPEAKEAEAKQSMLALIEKLRACFQNTAGADAFLKKLDEIEMALKQRKVPIRDLINIFDAALKLAPYGRCFSGYPREAKLPAPVQLKSTPEAAPQIPTTKEQQGQISRIEELVAECLQMTKVKGRVAAALRTMAQRLRERKISSAKGTVETLGRHISDASHSYNEPLVQKTHRTSRCGAQLQVTCSSTLR